jgi:hypothetical protein
LIFEQSFACCTGSKNPIRNRLKIHFLKLNFFKLIFQKSSTDQQGGNQMALECIPNTAHKSSQHCLLSLLICTLISENQDLQKSRSLSKPRKISDSANLDQALFHERDLEKN